MADWIANRRESLCPLDHHLKWVACGGLCWTQSNLQQTAVWTALSRSQWLWKGFNSSLTGFFPRRDCSKLSWGYLAQMSCTFTARGLRGSVRTWKLTASEKMRLGLLHLCSRAQPRGQTRSQREPMWRDVWINKLLPELIMPSSISKHEA